MNLFEKMAYELLREDSPSTRLMGLNDIQKIELQSIKKHLEDYFTKMNFWKREKTGKIKKNSGKGEDYRININNIVFDVPQAISTAVKTAFPGTRAFLISPGYPGAKSGTFPTVKIVSQSGSEIYIVLSGSGRKTISKQFTPQGFKVEGELYQYKDLYKNLMTKIKAAGWSDDIRNYLLFLLDSVIHGSITKTSNSITINKKDYDDSDILHVDRTGIQSDFGEILSAIAIARSEQDSIFFPKSATEPLIDFEIGNVRYSAKSLKGAGTTLTSMAKYYDYVRDEMDIPEKERAFLLKVFDAIKGNIGVEQTYLVMTKLVDKPAWNATLELLGVDDLIIDDSKTALKIIKEKLDGYLNDKTLNEKLKKFYTTIGKTPTTSIDKYELTNRLRHGYVVSPLASLIAKVLNENKFHILDNMKELINQLDNVKQVNFYNQYDKFIFKITNLDKNVNIEFVSGVSVDDPNKQHLKFKIT